jgi:hypothetical protein
MSTGAVPDEPCPRCDRGSWSVPQSATVLYHVRPESWPVLKPRVDDGTRFRFCPHEGCPVVYFHRASALVILEAEIRTRIGYKVREAPVPACYCTGVLAETIRDEIVVRGCCDSLDDIKRYTGARTGTLCHVTNPAGRCCGSLVQRAVERRWASAPTRSRARLAVPRLASRRSEVRGWTFASRISEPPRCCSRSARCAC